jgi:thioredoxin reductase (NADPH)
LIHVRAEVRAVTPVKDAAMVPLVPGGRLRVLDRFTSASGLELRTFLSRNRVLFEWVDVDADPLARFLLGAPAAPDGDIEARLAGVRFPVLLLADGRRLEAPSHLEVARAVGLPTRPTQQEYDLAIVGGGPAGLTAAVYAASEGLRTVVLEREAPGGQAGASARIENYPGFPDGISGLELTQRTYEQARRFDAEFVLVNEVTAADPSAREPFRLSLLDETELRSRAVLLATGVEYRLLDVPGVAELTGRGICYGSRVSEAFLYRGSEMFVVGSGNSAGQAAVYFAKHARQVSLLVRGDSLERSMSQYLIRQLEEVPNLGVRYHTELAAAEGTDRLEALVLRNQSAGTETRVPADGLAILVGQKPYTDWADGILARDGQGFLLTGPDLPTARRRPRSAQNARARPAAFRTTSGSHWPLARPPLFLETSVPGVFAVGDVRHGSPKRIASAVGDGALAVQLVHTYLGLYAAADARALNGAGVPRDVANSAGFLKQLG